MATTHDSIADALVSYCNEPEFCRRPTVEIDALLLEQLRAKSSHGLSIRNRRPTARYIAVTRELGPEAAAAVAEFGREPTTRPMDVDELQNIRSRVIASCRNTTRGRFVAA